MSTMTAPPAEVSISASELPSLRHSTLTGFVFAPPRNRQRANADAAARGGIKTSSLCLSRTASMTSMKRAAKIRIYGVKSYSSEMTAPRISDIHAQERSIISAMKRTAAATAFPNTGTPSRGRYTIDSARKGPASGVSRRLVSGAASGAAPNSDHIIISVKQFAESPVRSRAPAPMKDLAAQTRTLPAFRLSAVSFFDDHLVYTGRNTAIPNAAEKESINPASTIAAGETIRISTAARNTELTPSLSAP